MFNQMLSSGVVRGVQLLSSSQFEQYDGLYRIVMAPPFERFVRSEINPLGVEDSVFDGQVEEIRFPVCVLEYKFTLDALIEEFQQGVKQVADVKLVVVWEFGEKWRSEFSISSYLIEDNVHHRPWHGVTHVVLHEATGVEAFSLIALKDLVAYLADPDTESVKQSERYGDEPDLT